MRRVFIMLMLAAITTSAVFGQTTAPSDIIRLVLQKHLGTTGLPNDIVIQAQVTGGSTTSALRMTVKGKNQIRYENTQGARTTVSIFNAGTAWTGPAGSLKPLMEHAAIRRPIEIPFLDILIDVGAPRWTIRLIGPETLGGKAVLHFAVHYPDSVPVTQRFLSRPLNEDAEFFVDATTSLIVRSQRMEVASDSMDFRVPSVLDFSDYRLVNGLMIPFHLVSTVGNRNAGIIQTTIVIQSVQINQGITDSAFLPQ